MAQHITADQAIQHVQNQDALLICAYDSEEKCQKHQVEGAIPLKELRALEEQISKDRELIFYCA